MAAGGGGLARLGVNGFSGSVTRAGYAGRKRVLRGTHLGARVGETVGKIYLGS
jgi:hypothetical protein